MKIALGIIAIYLLSSCAASSPQIKHTIVVKGSSSAVALNMNSNDLLDHIADLAVGDSPSSLSVRVKRLYAGSAANCSDLKLVRRLGQSGVASEIFNNTSREIISARPTENQVYRCIAVAISDNISFRPNDQAIASYANCAAQSYDVDIFTGGANNDLEGNVNAGSALEQDLYFIISLAAPAFAVQGNQRFTLSSELNISSPFDIILYADYNNQVVDTGVCSLNGFRIGLR